MSIARYALIFCLLLVPALSSGGQFHGFDPAAYDGLMFSQEALKAMVAEAVEKSPPKNGESLVFGFANLQRDMSFGIKVEKSIERNAEAAGIELLIADNRLDGPTAMANAESFARRRADFVIEFQTDVNFGPAVMQHFDRKMIDVVAIDIPMPGATFFGANNPRSGFMGGSYLAQAAKVRFGERALKEGYLVVGELPQSGVIPAMRTEGQIAGFRASLPEFSLDRIIRIDTKNTLQYSFQQMGNALGRIPPGAPILITAINVLVGLVVGVAIHGVEFGEAVTTYTLLTVGDGLVSQIPALIVSTAAGLLVSKGGMSGKTGNALGEQLGRYPKAFAMVSVLMTAFALLPGFPFLPFAFVAAASGYYGWWASRKHQEQVAREKAEKAEAEIASAETEEPIANTIAIDAVRVELGYGLLPIIKGSAAEPRLDDQVRALRRQMATDFGFVLPAVRIIDNMGLGAHDYRVYIRETEVAAGELRLDKLMVINPGGGDVGLPGDIAQEPVFGLPALWIDRELRDEAGLRDLTVVDCGTIVTTHLAELVKDNIADLLSYTETQKLLNEVHRDAEKLVADLVPAKISISGIQRILQNLLAEGVSVRDMTTILEAIAETAPLTQNLTQITEHVRARLARQISAQQTRDGSIPILTLSPDWDQQFAESIIGDGDERHLAMAPSNLQRFITQVRELYDTLAANNEIPCILVSPSIRPFVRSIIERVRPATVVLSQNEIHPRTRVRSVGSIGQQTSLEAP